MSFMDYVSQLEGVDGLDHHLGGEWIYDNRLWVYQTPEGASIRVSPEGPPDDERGGYLLLSGATAADVGAWLDKKCDLYL